MILLTRDIFRESVFARDKYKCVICKGAGQDAHHIMERRLFKDGGYYLDNGATLCGNCHIQAETTALSCEEIRNAAGITKRILPEHLYEDYDYDKWGNILNTNGSRYPGELFWDESVQKILGSYLGIFLHRIKYPRTFHLPWSLGRTDDDKTLSNCSIFEGQEVVITEKMDGENTTGYSDGYIHARSIDSNNHASRNWVKNYLPTKLFDLPNGWRVCGENLFAKHSIHYTNLGSYFYLFSIWTEQNVCLSWDETEEWAKLLDLKTVPVLFRGSFDEDFTRNISLSENIEGYVIRLTNAFPYGNFRQSAAKFVRANHVQTNQHWIKTKIIPNEL
jgi:hypothetical protein